MQIIPGCGSVSPEPNTDMTEKKNNALTKLNKAWGRNLDTRR